MELKINIVTGESCSFNIKDITPVSPSGYLDESSEEYPKGKFKYSDTVGIVSLGVYKLKDNRDEYMPPIFIDHKEDPQFTTIPTGFDGVFDVCFMVIPTKKWFEEHPELHSQYKIIYYSDGMKVYKYFLELEVEVPVQELIEINPNGTTISRSITRCVSICYLKKCFISLCQLILDLRTFSKCSHGHEVSCELKDNRDLVWMTINVISYLTGFGLFYEVQRIIDLINFCNGICKQSNRRLDNNGCGCS